ncbi:MAG: segregation/condensation protein A [Candidatus Paceibacterota bacterium]|jgi:segregation and condensation protein A
MTAKNANFEIKTEKFEGPLDLLLSLIEKRKMHISDISLAQVADDYISYLRSFENLPMSNTANFILIASTLMLIKSLSLLPGLAVTEEEKETIENLENRLRHYQQIKDLSLHLKDYFGKNIIFTRESSREPMIIFSPTAEIKSDNFLETIKKIITTFPLKEKLPETIVRKVVSLEEVISDLASRIQAAVKMSFNDFVQNKKEKVGVIVSFLGMLELVKQGIIDIKQEGHFSDIEMETTNVGVPRY